MVRGENSHKPWNTWAVSLTTAIFSFAEDGGGVSTQPQTLETQRWGWGRGRGFREHQGRRSPPEGTWHCPGTAPCWCHTCLPAIPRGGLHLSLAPRTGWGPHRPCRCHRPPAPCPRLCQSRAPHWLSPQGRRMLWRGCHLDQASLAAPVPIYLFFFLLRYNIFPFSNLDKHKYLAFHTFCKYSIKTNITIQSRKQNNFSNIHNYQNISILVNYPKYACLPPVQFSTHLLSLYQV